MLIGMQEWVVILLVVLLMFGGTKIPQLMKGLGQGIREFNNAKNDVKQKIEDEIKDDTKKSS
jgi:sec-independent protein translocase protein TatA